MPAIKRSPSSRRAWIEIVDVLFFPLRFAVALLAEGVDRNSYKTVAFNWVKQVALLAEGVDRNLNMASDAALQLCRPPRGGRG